MLSEGPLLQLLALLQGFEVCPGSSRDLGHLDGGKDEELWE